MRDGMKHFVRSLLLLVPLVVGLSALAPPGRAQAPGGSRFAFADTTLLRDTLGLKFDNLYPVADSLGMLPDTLRALSIRYRYPIERLLVLSDSLSAPVDSVGVIMLRERFNPLAADFNPPTVFTYTSQYGLAQTSRNWSNGTIFNYGLRRMYLTNLTDIVLNDFSTAGSSRSSETRSSVTTLDYRVNPGLSLGGRASISRTDDDSQGELLRYSTSVDEYQASMRFQRPMRGGYSSNLNLLTGFLSVDDLTKEKRGLSADLNGRLRFVRGTWFTHDAQGQITTNFSNTRPLTVNAGLLTNDLSENLRGTMGLWQSSPISLNANYMFRNSRVENPVARTSTAGAESTYIQDVLSGNNSVDMSLRLRRDADRFVNLQQRFARSRQASASNISQLNTRSDRAFVATGRYAYRAFALDGNFGVGVTGSEFPSRSAQGGYAEDAFTRNIDGTLSWQATRRFTVRLNGSVNLSSYRYTVIGAFPTPPVPRDFYVQSYRVSGLYNPIRQFGTDIGLTVSRTLFINIPAASTAANNEVRGYRGNWNWTYRPFAGLTITQNNRLGADYTDAQLTSNDRLTLDYQSITTLNVVVSNLQIDLTHTSQYKPAGNFLRAEDGTYYLATADEDISYRLAADVRYAVTQAISFHVQPAFSDNDRQNSVNGEIVPQRGNRYLSFSGGADLHLQLGKALLSGSIQRTYNSGRVTNYTSGVPTELPRVESDFWNGILTFSWTL